MLPLTSVSTVVLYIYSNNNDVIVFMVL